MSMSQSIQFHMLHMNADNFSVTQTQCQCHSQCFKCTLFKLYFSSIQQCIGAQVPFRSRLVKKVLKHNCFKLPPVRTSCTTIQCLLKLMSQERGIRPCLESFFLTVKLSSISRERLIKQSHSLVASMGTTFTCCS